MHGAGNNGGSCKRLGIRSEACVARSASGVGVGDVACTVGAWREQWRQLGLQAWSAESDSRRETQNPRFLSQDQVEELRSSFSKGDSEFHEWEKDLWSGLGKVRKRIRVLGRSVHFAPNQEDVRRMVQCAEHDLRIFAEQTRQQQDELATLECSLQDTLEASLARFEGWCSQESCTKRPSELAKKTTRAPSCSRARQDSNIHKEAKQLDSMHGQVDKIIADIATDGGSTGGWATEDHETFLQVFRKFKKKTGVEFLAEVQQLLPDKTHEDLVAHVAWLLVYEERQLQKRQLIDQWRCMRAAISAPKAPPDSSKELTAEMANEEKRQDACAKQRAQREHDERRQRVAEWRRMRNEEQRIQEEERQRREHDTKDREASDRKRMSAQRQHALKSLREQRAAEEELLSKCGKNGPSTSLARPVSAENRKRVADRNTSHLQKRASQLNSKRFVTDGLSFEPPARSASNPVYRHVESRLEDHTKTFVDRSRELRAETLHNPSSSKYDVIPGNFAHQGVVRTLRSSPCWRPHFGV